LTVLYFPKVATWLVVAGIPSIITGLSEYPKADGFVKGLKTVLNMLSMLTHSDSPGTFKLPFKRSESPLSFADKSDTDPVKLPAMMLPFILIPLLFVSTACAGWNAWTNCELGKLPQTVQALVANVSAIAAQPSGYVEDLANLSNAVGADQVNCVVQAIQADLAKPRGTAIGSYRSAQSQHLREYIDKQKNAGHSTSCRPLQIF
jgi:hypothetical protein